MHYIGMDTHCHFTELAAVDSRGRVTRRWSGPTTIPELRKILEEIPGRKNVTFEEGPLADWLYRNLREFVDRVVVCDPRRNAYIAKDSDKDDPIDAEKLAQLLRGKYLSEVHHPESLERAVFKQHVGLYHRVVGLRVREANRLMAQLRRWGIIVRESAFRDEGARAALLPALSEEPELRAQIDTLLALYDASRTQELALRRRLVSRARREEVLRRWSELPGISWIRGATFLAYLDTPWRFKSKSALWRYMGVGLERRESGRRPRRAEDTASSLEPTRQGGKSRLRLSQRANRHLKDSILGAARSAIAAGDNPFAERFRRWEEKGLSYSKARRNVARSLAMVLWGMWKNGGVYRPELVALP